MSRQQNTATKSKPESETTNPLLRYRNGKLPLEYKVGSLFYRYISESSLATKLDEPIRGEHVAGLLESLGYIKTRTRIRSGVEEHVFHWLKKAPSKSDFFKNILNPEMNK